MAPERERLVLAEEAIRRTLGNGQSKGFSTVLDSTGDEGILRMDARNALIDLLSTGEVKSDSQLQVSIPTNGD